MIDPVVVMFAAHGVGDVTRSIATVSEQLARFEAKHTGTARRGKEERVRVAKEEARDVGGTAKTIAADFDKLERYKLDVRRRSSTMAGQYAAQQAREEIREHERASKEIIRIADRTAQQRARILTSGVRNVGRSARAAMTLAGATMGIGGGLFLADAARRELSDEKTAQQIMNIVTVGNGGARPAGASIKAILGRAGQVAGETGISRDVIAQSAFTYAANARGGNYEGMMENMGFFAKLANVTGGDINEIASGAATLQGQNADLSDPKKMREMMSTIYSQSGKGGTSFKNIVGQIGNITSARGYFSGDEGEAQKKLLGLAQIAVTGGAAGDVGTYIRSMATQAGAHRHRKGKTAGLEDMGVKFNKEGQIEDATQMVGKVFESTGGDLSKIHEIFAKRGMEVFTELHKTFDAAGGGKKGAAAAVAAMNDVINAPAADIDKMAAETMQTPGAKISAAIEKIRNSLEEKLAPGLERFASYISKPEVEQGIENFISEVTKAATWMTEHIGPTLALAITASIGKAAIGEVIAMLLKKSFGGASGGGGIPGVPGVPGTPGGKGLQIGGAAGVLGAVAAAPAILYAAYSATTAGMSAIDDHFDATAKTQGDNALKGALGAASDINARLGGADAHFRNLSPQEQWDIATHQPAKPVDIDMASLLRPGEGGPNPFANVKPKAKTADQSMDALAKTVGDLNTPFVVLTSKMTDMITAADNASKALSGIGGGGTRPPAPRAPGGPIGSQDNGNQHASS